MAVFPPRLCLGVLLCLALHLGACRKETPVDPVKLKKHFDAEEFFTQAVNDPVSLPAADAWQRVLVDLNQAISLDPEEPKYYLYRGQAQNTLGKLDAAVADFTQTLKLGGSWPDIYFQRGNAYYEQQNWPAALQDYRRFVEVDPGSAVILAQLSIWLIRARTGEKAAADHELTAYIEAFRRKEKTPFWDPQIADFLLDKITEQDLFKSPYGRNGQNRPLDARETCQAYYFIGVKKLVAGDKGGASEAFRKSVATHMPREECREFGFAAAELKALGEPPATKDKLKALGMETIEDLRTQFLDRQGRNDVGAMWALFYVKGASDSMIKLYRDTIQSDSERIITSATIEDLSKERNSDSVHTLTPEKVLLLRFSKANQTGSLAAVEGYFFIGRKDGRYYLTLPTGE